MNELRKAGMAMMLGLVLLAMAGCQSARSQTVVPQPGAQADAVQQLIVKFKSRTVACDIAGVAAFASASQVPVEFVRPMSGDACIVKPHSANPVSLSEIQQRLKNHPAVEWVEIDRAIKAFQ